LLGGKKYVKTFECNIGNTLSVLLPGIVTVGGVLQPALKWEHYKLQSDDQGVTTAARVWNEFWVIFVITCITCITTFYLIHL
jgi:hypothetical protein